MAELRWSDLLEDARSVATLCLGSDTRLVKTERSVEVRSFWSKAPSSSLPSSLVPVASAADGNRVLAVDV